MPLPLRAGYNPAQHLRRYRKAMFHWWMTDLIKATLAGIVLVIGYIAYWAIRDKELLGSRKGILVRKPEPENYETPVAPI